MEAIKPCETVKYLVSVCGCWSGHRVAYGAEPSDVGLRGYPESPIRGARLDDGETLDRPTTFTHKSLSSVNLDTSYLLIISLLILSFSRFEEHRSKE
ncbi:MAG: hypothetical protein ACTSWP_04335 [Candidatus Freyarchaeota archaeon]